MTTPSEIIKELSQQCCDEIEGHCYQESDGGEYSYSNFDAEKARGLIELYMLRLLADAGKLLTSGTD
jgi:hypothetical protein